MTSAADLKQACLDLSNAALTLFDAFDEHGTGGAWEGDNALAVLKMTDAFDALRSFLSLQAAMRLRALGVSPETLTLASDGVRARRARG